MKYLKRSLKITAVRKCLPLTDGLKEFIRNEIQCLSEAQGEKKKEEEELGEEEDSYRKD